MNVLKQLDAYEIDIWHILFLQCIRKLFFKCNTTLKQFNRGISCNFVYDFKTVTQNVQELLIL